MRRLVNESFVLGMPTIKYDPKYIEEWVRERMIYTVDDPVEIIRTPANMFATISKTGHFNGDCDDAAILVCAIAHNLGMNCRLVAISDGILDQNYSHVFTEIQYNNEWVAVDPTIPDGTDIIAPNCLKVTI
jgi:transglutaminase-like putative cysteine protease